MSTLSGIFPNAITPSMPPVVDPAQQALQRRQNETAVFSPVNESEATSASQNRTGERPARQDSQRDAGRDADRPSEEPARQADSPNDEADNDAIDARRERGTTEPRADAGAAPQRSEASGGQARAPSEDGAQARPARDEARPDNTREVAERRQEREQLEAIRDLARRDREVRAHEQAHQVVGGQYAGAMNLQFETGPNGRRYAVAGEVPIDIGPVPGNPEATVDKARQVQRAALAPAEPSAQDRAVAARATQLELQAQVELREQQSAELNPEDRAEETQAGGNEDQAIAAESETRTERSAERDDRRDAQAAETARERLDTTLEQNRETNDRMLVLDQYRQQQQKVGINLDFVV